MSTLAELTAQWNAAKGTNLSTQQYQALVDAQLALYASIVSGGNNLVAQPALPLTNDGMAILARGNQGV